MTITIAWLRRKKNTVELVVASDSRLRSHGALDQAQKIFQLDRGDCCLAFCGDAQVAYPFFIQVGTTLNNFIKTRTRAEDITQLSGLIGQILNNLIGSWDLPEKEKAHELRNTRILFGGWSWENRRFDIGYFAHETNGFRFHHRKARKPHPWVERERSLIFIGDYEADYMMELKAVLERRHSTSGGSGNKVAIDFDYEPVEALQALLTRTAGDALHPAIGGAVQIVKVYAYGQTLPFVVRPSRDAHFLLGRRLFDWEKTEYPVLDLTGFAPVVHYPKRSIPLPRDLSRVDVTD